MSSADKQKASAPIQLTSVQADITSAIEAFTAEAADPLSFYPYDVTPDGNRFLVISPVNAGAAPLASAPDSTPITVVVNWSAALKK
jgi:hypothetical protein